MYEKGGRKEGDVVIIMIRRRKEIRSARKSIRTGKVRSRDMDKV